MKNYVDTNPPKSWLDLFTIKQVKIESLAWISSIALSAEICQECHSLKLSMYNNTADTGSISLLDFLTSIFLCLYICVSLCIYCAWAQFPWWWVILTLKADHAVTSSCFCLCHRGSVSLLSTWSSSAPSYTSVVHHHMDGNKYWQMVQINTLQT